MAQWKGDLLPRLHFFDTTEVEELDDKEKATLSLTKTLNNAIDKANNRFLSQMQREEAAKAKKRDRAAAQDRGYQVGGGDDGFQFKPALSSSSSPPPVQRSTKEGHFESDQRHDAEATGDRHGQS